MSKAERRRRKQQRKYEARAAERLARRRARFRRLTAAFLAVLTVVALVLAGVGLVFGRDEEDSATTPTTATTTTTTLPEELAAIRCSDEEPAAAREEKPTFDAPPSMQIDKRKTYRAIIETSCGRMVAELDAAAAPTTVNNFVFLARRGFYDGLTWHRVVRDFVIQGGDPKGDGTGGPGYTIEEEPPEDRTYAPGDLAMAKSSAPRTTGSQFFVVTGDPAPLNANPVYSKFGRLVEGLDVARRIEHFVVPGTETPSRPVYIVSITIEEAP